MIKKLFKKKIIDINICVLVLIISIISIAIFRRYIFEGYYLISDSNSDIIRANVPTYYHMYDAISKGGFLWSWQMGIGTSMFSHADCFCDPFVYLLFMFGRNHILEMLVYMVIFKLIFSGITSYLYLSNLKFNNIAALIASILYSFSGYSIITGNNFALGTICVYIPLILLGAEKYLKENKVLLLFISLFLTCIYSYYYFYICGIFLAIYVLYRMISNKTLSITKLFGFFVIGTLTILSSSFILFPQIELVLQSKRVTNSESYNILTLLTPNIESVLTFLTRSFSNDALGNKITNQYCGSALLSVNDYFQNCQFFSSLFIYFFFVMFDNEKKQKKKEILLITIFLIAFISLPVFSYIFNAFKMITLRWEFVLSVVQAVVVAEGISKMISDKKIFYFNSALKSLLLSIIIILVSFLFIVIKKHDIEILSTYSGSISSSIIHILFAYLVLIFAELIIRLKNFNKKFAVASIALISFALVLCDYSFNYYFLQCDDILINYSEENNVDYNDSSATIISEILPNNDEFYRINKSFDSVKIDRIDSYNDAMVQGYFGLKNYNSLPNTSYENFLQNVDIYTTYSDHAEYCKENGISPKEITGQVLNYIPGVGDRYNLMTYLGVKYYLTKEPEENVPYYYKLLSDKYGIKLYENEYYMPFIFCNDNYMSEEEFSKLNSNEKDIALLSTTILSAYDNSNSEAIINLENILNDIKQKQENCKIITFTNDSIDIEFNATSEICSTQIPYDSNWKVYVDGNEVDKKVVNIGFIGFDIEPGLHKIKIVYEPESFFIGIKISAISLIISVFCFNIKKIINAVKIKLLKNKIKLDKEVNAKS